MVLLTSLSRLLEIELDHLKFIRFTLQLSNLSPWNKKKHITPDLVCYDKVIIELKAVKALCEEHRAQVINYLKITGLELGLLVNFGSYPKVEWERIVLTHQ